MTLKERLAKLEAMAKRTDEQDAELTKVRADIAKEDKIRADKEAKDLADMEAIRTENNKPLSPDTQNRILKEVCNRRVHNWETLSNC